MTIRELEKIIQGVPEQDKDKTINLWVRDRTGDYDANAIILDKDMFRDGSCQYFLGITEESFEDYESDYAWDEKV